ncbi:MAG: glutathione S-transferase N-terminal domain-containing protein [Thermaurantiacus sp.]
MSLRLIIGNRRYSSWSLRGWLAARHAGLPFEVELVNLYAEDWTERRARPDLAVSAGLVPVLWDGAVAAFHSLGIIAHLERRSGGTRFWPAEPAAHAFAASIAAEMQSAYAALRRHCPMNVMRHYPGWHLHEEAAADVARIDSLWCHGIGRFGGPWLAGADYGAADILFAPVASRFTTYAVALSPVAEAYRARAMAHPFMAEWIAAAAAEVWRQPAHEF